MIPAQAPQYRQYALISDFLGLANQSMQPEAALATNSILPENVTADVHHAIDKCEFLGQGDN